MKHKYIREKAFDARNCKYKEVEWFEYSEEEQKAVRQARKTRARASPPKIKKLNDNYSRKHFRWLLFNNFGNNDYHVTLTFDDKHLKKGISDCKREFANYIKRLKRLYAKHGLKLRYLYVVEGKSDGSRLHYHLIINGGVNRDDVEKLWTCGKRVNCDRLQLDDDGTLTALANYLMKSQDSKKKCERAWNGSLNLKRPDVTTDDNKISRKTMRKVQEAARNDEVKKVVERLYPNYTLLDYDIGQNEVTGRPYARFRLIRKQNKKGQSP